LESGTHGGWGTADKAMNLVRYESPIPSIARIGWLAYPGHGEATNRDKFGCKSHGCSVKNIGCRRSNLSIEQSSGFERYGMAATS